ncbi:TetR/AcrR family transcriptional regulator [Methylomonas sp. LL1]|uniref:TetR/AcrR family transcriptional regulator n=1 Tax=Methylomonas sp. LL1 TaxID=2785785 RepID=UPI0019368348|nr:TetR/AcrR family transcriptional regulator [Methylomonas sp. LL1]QPK61565.1 TetR/AcrR family transcriptional regulator [Methylomonas sp. LL1]
MISTTNIADKPARDRILLTAHDLFYRDGIRATGIDKVIAESGVSKVTFYRHFPSKHDLIRAFLDYRHWRWMAWFTDALPRHGARSGGGLLPLVATLEEWFSSPVFRGCAFINITAELGDAVPDVLDICRNHKQDMLMIIADLLPESASRMVLANAAALAVDGAIVKAQLGCGKDDEAKAALHSLSVILTLLDQFDRSQ